MLPFGRMLQYGNIKQLPKIVKVSYGYNNLYILYDNGELYGCGANEYLQLNVPGTTIHKGWVLIADGVEKMWSGGQNVLYYKNKKFMMHGSMIVLSSSAAAIPLGGMDVSSTFPVIEDVKDFSIGMDSMHYIHSNEVSLYGRGGNSYSTVGGGIPGAQETFTSVFSSGVNTIKDVYGTQYNTIVHISNGDIRGCGTSQYGSLGVPSSVYTTMLVRATNVQIVGGTSGSTHVYVGGGSLDYTGWQLNGQLGNGLNSNVQVYPFTRNTISSDINIHAFSRSSSNGSVNLYGTSTGDIYSTGAYGRNGTPAIITSWTKTLSIPDYDSTKATLMTMSTFSTVYDGVGNIYVCGSGTATPGSNINAMSWNKLVLPI